jgi:hypothetical protein
MNNKAFFQIVAVIAFVVMIVFLFRNESPGIDLRVVLTGGIFVVGAALSLIAGPADRGDGDAK